MGPDEESTPSGSAASSIRAAYSSARSPVSRFSDSGATPYDGRNRRMCEDRRVRASAAPTNAGVSTEQATACHAFNATDVNPANRLRWMASILPPNPIKTLRAGEYAEPVAIEKRCVVSASISERNGLLRPVTASLSPAAGLRMIFWT